MKQDAAQRRNEVLTGLLIVVVVWGGLLLGEVALRAIQYAKFGVLETMETSDKFYVNAQTGLRLARPNQVVGKTRINSLGFRGPDLPVHKEAQTFRVAFLGNSTTFDANSDESQSWPSVAIASIKAAASSNCRIEFINAGMPGYGIPQSQLLYETRIRKLSPDLVVFMPGGLNEDLAKLAKDKGFQTYEPPQGWLARNSVLYQLLIKNFRTLQLQRAAFNRKGKMTVEVHEATQPFSQGLGSFANAVESDALLALVTIPSLLRREQSPSERVRAAVSAIYWMPYLMIDDIVRMRQAYNDLIRELAQQRGLILVSNEDAIPADGKHFADTMHFRPPGAAANARRVADGLMASKQLRLALERAGCRLRDSSMQ